MYGEHPYLDAFFTGFGEQAEAAQNARNAAAILGRGYVNEQLMDAMRWGASEYQQAELAGRLAAEAALQQLAQMQRQRYTAEAANAARRARTARRRRAAELLLLSDA